MILKKKGWIGTPCISNRKEAIHPRKCLLHSSAFQPFIEAGQYRYELHRHSIGESALEDESEFFDLINPISILRLLTTFKLNWDINKINLETAVWVPTPYVTLKIARGLNNCTRGNDWLPAFAALVLNHELRSRKLLRFYGESVNNLYI